MEDDKIKYVAASDLQVGSKCLTVSGKTLTVTSNVSVLHSFVTVSPKKGASFSLSSYSDLALHSCGYRDLRYGERFTLDAESHDLMVDHILHRIKLYHCPIFLPQADLPIPPYIYGYWICKAKGSSIRFLDKSVIEAFKEYAAASGLSFQCTRDTLQDGDDAKALMVQDHNSEKEGFKPVRKRKHAEYRQQIWYYAMDQAFLDVIRKHGLASNSELTHQVCNIHEMYMNGSREQRIEMLSGILDACGHIQQHGATYDIMSRYELFIHQVRRLALSVGLIASIHYTDIINVGRYTRRRVMSGEGTLSKVPRLYISGDIDILSCRNPNKKVSSRKRNFVTGFTVTWNEDAQVEIFQKITLTGDQPHECLLNEECIAISCASTD